MRTMLESPTIDRGGWAAATGGHFEPGMVQESRRAPTVGHGFLYAGGIGG